MPRSEKPSTDGFRRRIPLELTAPEFACVERAQGRYGTKRAALVAGLVALEEAEGLEAQLAQAEAARVVAVERVRALEQQLAKGEQVSAKGRQQAAGAKKAAEAERRQKRALEQARKQVDELRQALAYEQRVRGELEDEVDELQVLLPEALRCARCNKWAPQEEWAVHLHEGREFLYHDPCGLHNGSAVTASSLLGYRDHA